MDEEKPGCAGCEARKAWLKGRMTAASFDEGGTVAFWRMLSAIGFGLAIVAIVILIARKGGTQA